MSKRERVAAAIRGEEVDHPPAGFWGHDFLREWSAEGLAAAMVESVETYDYDYLKINPRATYYAEAWGCRYTPPDDPARAPETEHWTLREPSDLEGVRPVDGTGGPFAEQLDALRRIGAGLGGEVPLVQTVFSPLSVVSRMADGREPVRTWMGEAPDALHGALGAVTETLSAYALACLDAGADGIFFPTTEWGSYDACTKEEYETFGRPYDLRVLEAVKDAEVNILHVCRANNMMELLLDYPAPIVNWADRAPGNLSLADAMAKTDKAVMGGVDVRVLYRGSPEDVREQVQDAIGQTDGRRFLLAPSCSISPQTPPENLRAAMKAVRDASE